MRNLPVLQNDSDSKRDLRNRIALSNRPRMALGLKRLDDVSSSLAKNNEDRTRFVQDPAAYLQAQSLPVSSCNLVQSSLSQTTEACTINVVCLANVVASLIAGVVTATVSLVVQVALIYSRVAVAGTEIAPEVIGKVDGYGNPSPFMGTAI